MVFRFASVSEEMFKRERNLFKHEEIKKMVFQCLMVRFYFFCFIYFCDERPYGASRHYVIGLNE